MQCEKLNAQVAAEHYANTVAPLPGCDSIAGTMLAVFASTVVAAIFTILAGVFLDTSIQLPSAITIAFVGAGVYRVIRSAEQRHNRARLWMEEIMAPRECSREQP